jgi:hypothetical protein
MKQIAMNAIYLLCREKWDRASRTTLGRQFFPESADASEAAEFLAFDFLKDRLR